MENYIRIHPDDTVAVALAPLTKGQIISIGELTLTLLEDIPQGHKFALCDMPEGAPVVKYGSTIGYTKADVSAGGWVHVHNIRTGLGELLTYNYEPIACAVKPTEPRTFNGYRRSDGKAGVRNEIWIVPTVGCVNDVVKAIADQAQSLQTDAIDAIVSFSHPYGCSQMGDDQENTRQILANLIRHPNAGGVLVVGLGCENSNIGILKDYLGDYDDKRIKFLVAQEHEDEIADALAILKDLSAYVSTFKREPIDCNELIVGMKCGGSDGLSGITANPTVGVFSDMLASKGGTTILTEVPEMFGAETLLMNRCETQELFDKTVDLINDFKNYFKSHNQIIYDNPSPGNKNGGISTLEDKSMGCTQKSGSSPVKGVLGYGEIVQNKGLNLLSAPGNDLVASTALAASGAQIVLFTTGRGTPFASPVPTVKVSTNSTLYNRKKNWIDFNCGVLVEGTDMETLSQNFFDYVIEVASGRQTKSEEAGFHDLAIFKQGVTL